MGAKAIKIPRRGLKNIRCRRVVKVSGKQMEHSFESLIQLLKRLVLFGEIQGIRSPNNMIIKITFPNLLHSSDFLCFLFMNH